MAQDSESAPRRTPEPPFLEKKQKIDGTVREYRCTAAYRSDTFVVIRFPMRGGGIIPGTTIHVPRDSVSYGFFWANRPYNLYRMVTAAGEPFVHRFDAVADVSISHDSVSYRDLVLDWWALPDETLIEEDREDYEALVSSGEVSLADREVAREAAAAVFSRYRHIIERAGAFLAREGIRP